MFQLTATYNQFLFSVILFNIILILAYYNKKNPIINKITWGMVVIFCLFPFWGKDYFGLMREFYFDMDKSYRDPFYYYLKQITYENYIIFRIFIWGGALLLIQNICKYWQLKINIFCFFFVSTFLLIFSYARASLGMALYFMGITYLLLSNKKKSLILSIVFISCSYFGHRSFLPLILLAPICRYFILDRKRVLLIIILFPIISMITNRIFVNFADNAIDLGESFANFSESATRVSTLENTEASINGDRIAVIRNVGFYISYLFTLWHICLSTKSHVIPIVYKQLMTITTIILIISLSISMASFGATQITSYRYLFMSGIPIVICLSYLFQKSIVKHKYIYVAICCSLLFEEIVLLSTII